MKPKILMIDDEPAFIEIFREYLNIDYEFHSAETGKEGMHKIKHIQPDAALLDLNLPDFHGVELIEDIHKFSPHTAVIIVSGESNLKVVKKAMEFGIDDYITKPIQQQRLMVSIQRAIEKKKADADTN